MCPLSPSSTQSYPNAAVSRPRARWASARRPAPACNLVPLTAGIYSPCARRWFSCMAQTMAMLVSVRLMCSEGTMNKESQ